MAKKILIIDGDKPFVTQLTAAFEARGLTVASASEGKEGLELVKADPPDLVVLCVELRKTSGYSICSKLKKDADTRALPVVLVSAEATQKTFDDHRKLKVGRADEYLLKPVSPETILQKVEALIGPLPQEPAAIELEEEALGAEEDASSMVTEEPIHLEELDEIHVETEAHEAAPTPETLPSESELDLLDAAFDNLEQKPAADGDEHPPMEVDAESDEEPASHPQSLRLISQEDGGEESVFGSPAMAASDGQDLLATVPGDTADGSRGSGGYQKDYFQLKERLVEREKDLVRLREELAAKEKELLQQREHETELEHGIAKRDPQIKAWQQKAEALMAGQRRSDKELSSLRDDLKQTTSKLQSAERERDSAKSTASEQATTLERLNRELKSTEQRAREAEKKLQSVGSQAEDLEAELAGVRAQLDEVTTTSDDLKRRLNEVEDLHAKGEERLLRAYQRIKGDERLKEKTRKALSIALQLLEDTGSEEEERRT